MAGKSRQVNLVPFILIFLYVSVSLAKEKDIKADNDKEGVDKWKKKDIRDYTEADMERLLDQWEENDEDELEEDELPEWKKEPPKIDMSNLDTSNPEALLKATKKGRTLMMFVTVSGSPSRKETDEITQLWHTSLFNANMETQRFIVSDDRAIFMVNDGAKAWDIKDFLVTQTRCKEVTIEGKSYPGAGTDTHQADANKIKNDKSKNKDSDKKEKSQSVKNNNSKKDKEEL